METQRHRFRALDVELSADEEEEIEGSRKKIEHLLKNGLPASLDALLSGMLDPDELIEIPELELDLGSLDPDNIEEDFTLKLKNALIVAVLKAKSEPGSGKEEENETRKRSQLDLLEFFLRSGGMPWWKPSGLSESPEEILLKYLELSPERLGEMLLRVAAHSQARKRLSQRFSERTLRSIIRLVDIENHELIMGYSNFISRFYIGTFVPGSKVSDFRKTHWEILLTVVLFDPGKPFNIKSFLRGLLKGLAGRFNLTYTEILQEIIAWNEQNESFPDRPASFSAAFSSLVEEAPVVGGKMITYREFEPEESQAKEFKILLDWLEAGAPADYEHFDQLAITWERMMREAPQRLAFLLRSAGRSPEIRRKWAENMPAVLQFQILHLLYPEEKELLAGFEHDLLILIRERFPAFQDRDQLNTNLRTWILDYLLVEKGAVFSLRTLVRTVIWRLSDQIQESPQDILKELESAAAISGRSHLFKTSLNELVVELIGEENKEKGLENEIENILSAVQPPSSLELIKVLEASQSDQRILKTSILEWSRDTAFFKLFMKLSLSEKQKLIQLSEPSFYAFLFALHEDLRELVGFEPGSNWSENDWVKQLWEPTFLVLFRERPANFGQLSVSRRVLRSLASALKVPLKAWILNLLTYAQSTSHSLQLGHLWPELLRKIANTLPDISALSLSPQIEEISQREMMKRWGKNYSQQTLAQIEDRLTEDQLEQLSALEQDLSALQEHFQIIPGGLDPFIRLIREYFSAYVLKEMGRSFSLRTLFASIIWKLAGKYATTRGALLSKMESALGVGMLRIHFQSPIADLIHEASFSGEDLGGQQNQIEVILSLLRPDRAMLKELLMFHALPEYQERVKAKLQYWIAKGSLSVLISDLSEAELKAILQISRPVYAEAAFVMITRLREGVEKGLSLYRNAEKWKLTFWGVLLGYFSGAGESQFSLAGMFAALLTGMLQITETSEQELIEGLKIGMPLSDTVMMGLLMKYSTAIGLPAAFAEKEEERKDHTLRNWIGKISEDQWMELMGKLTLGEISQVENLGYDLEVLYESFLSDTVRKGISNTFFIQALAAYILQESQGSFSEEKGIASLVQAVSTQLGRSIVEIYALFAEAVSTALLSITFRSQLPRILSGYFTEKSRVPYDLSADVPPEPTVFVRVWEVYASEDASRKRLMLAIRRWGKVPAFSDSLAQLPLLIRKGVLSLLEPTLSTFCST